MSDYGMVTYDRGHTDDCWKWHHECARAEILKLNKLLDNWEAYADVSSQIIRSLRATIATLRYEIAEWEGYTKYHEYEEKSEHPW